MLDADEHDILLRGTRLVIPRSLQRHVVDLSHSGHLGIVKTKHSVTRKGMVSFY